MPTRRRFLTISAAALAFPRTALASPTVEWRGRALGTEARVLLAGTTPAEARRTFAGIERVLAGVEARFSLHRDSDLTRLNRIGRLAWPGRDMLALLRLAGEVHASTGGAFDPTIQPLWLAAATGGDLVSARKLVGWGGVHVARDEIRLSRPGMALTFNGIAQGYASDLVADFLRSQGFGNVLVDIGEVVALGDRPDGTPWRASVILPDGSAVTGLQLSDRALATSSPMGTRIGPDGQMPHVLAPDGAKPHWQVVSVTADRAALADALSTAFCLMDRSQIERALATFPTASLAALA